MWCEPGETRAAPLEIAFNVFKAAGVASLLYLVEYLGILGGEKRQAEINQLHHLILKLDSIMGFGLKGIKLIFLSC